ncbi:phosphate/phosphite/phosphonate ABC transporter substrate-binding protein [Imhoffiella purpurea]|uniref:Phosphonate ABC transporter phosphate-binding periplasmic component n=1 Tax=Imhoffiella purpurea TaxID=1249627 RepID=W9V373_9GAMM|nr:phosphate/phosphite/phosphonate ABC transporter substrate-binding protein [Imhoffiella purpurea]EXJ13789.1 Phosphonate ABC transporter phosphate-binding periplasmic component [Imhoffiella purpurea]
MKRSIRLVLAAILCATAGLGVSAEPLTFGIVPQQSAKTLAQRWTPITTYLSKKTGERIRFATAPDIPTFEQRVLAGEYDIAYMNPYHYTVFHRRPGYEAIAKEADKKIRGILVVREDSDLETLADLAGLKLAFPSPAAFAASVLPMAEIKQRGISFEPSYVSSHDSVYMGVARGFFAAGGGIMRTFDNTDPSVRSQLRILWTTRGYTPHAIATHPRVGPTVAKALQRGLLEMNRDPRGRALLEGISFKGIEAAQDSDWDDVRALDIDLLDALLERH